MRSNWITTLLPDLPAMSELARPYSPIHYEPAELQKLAEQRTPFWVMMTIKNPTNPAADPVNKTLSLLRYPGVKFDVEFYGASSNLTLSGLRLIGPNDTHTDARQPVGAAVGAVGAERRIWRWYTPLIIKAHTPFRVEVFYSDTDGPVADHEGWVVLHGVRIGSRRGRNV